MSQSDDVFEAANEARKTSRWARLMRDANSRPTYAERVDAWVALADDYDLGSTVSTGWAQVWATMHLAEVMGKRGGGEEYAW